MQEESNAIQYHRLFMQLREIEISVSENMDHLRRPCDYSDLSCGSKREGVLALMLGRLNIVIRYL